MTAQDARINNPSYLTAHTEFTKSLPQCFLELSTLLALVSALNSTWSEKGLRYPTLQDPCELSLLTCPQGKSSLCCRQAG